MGERDASLSWSSWRLSKFARTQTASPIQELSHLAQRCGAINLAEGFPDFPAPPHLKDAAVAAINSDLNQYRHVQGICDLIAEIMKERQGLDIDPLKDVAICCGQTEAFAAAVLATIDPGDEVLLFDPSYETYESCILMAGGVPVYVPLKPPHWTLDTEEFLKSFSAKTKAVILNSPHNPTGKVFSREELKVIAEACCNKNCLAITDEVYEFITFDMQVHLSLASFPGMQHRTIITSSISKTFSVTDVHWDLFLEMAETKLTHQERGDIGLRCKRAMEQLLATQFLDVQAQIDEQKENPITPM